MASNTFVCLSVFTGTQVGTNLESGSGLGGTTKLEALATTPKSFSRLFPSIHTLSSLSSIRDTSRYSGIKTTHFDEDVGIMAQDSALIGQGGQFDVRRVKMCCNDGFFVLKSALSAAYRKRGQAIVQKVIQSSSQQRKEEDRMIRAVFHEYRALSHPPIREHPNIVDILDLGWETDPENRKDKWPVLVLEYADQGTMADFLAQSDLSLETRTKLCLDVARGLEVIHESGIIHGDLKMDNVLVFTNKSAKSGSVDRYTAKLADFGTSLVGEDGQQVPSYSRPWNGPEYLARLDFEGHKRHDTYSFGLFCWAVVLGGRNPFKVVERVFRCLEPSDFEASVERLKRQDGGQELLRLAQESFKESFGHRTAPAGVLDSTLQLDPDSRDLAKAAAALEGFLQPLRTEEEETNAARSLPPEVRNNPPVCSHKILHTPNELKKYRGALRSYLQEMLQEEHSAVSGAGDQGNDRLARSLLAELELDDWLEGRSPDPIKAIGHYRAISNLLNFESATVCSLAFAFLRGEQLKSVLDAENVRNSMVEAFSSGYTPALRYYLEHFQGWATDHAWLPLVCNNAGAYDTPVTTYVYSSITKNSHTSVLSALKLAFPNLTLSGDEIDNPGQAGLVSDLILDEESGNMAVHLLSQVGAVDLLKELLKIPGVDINARNRRLDTPLLLAARAGRFGTAMLLLEEGADVSLVNSLKENALHWLSSFRLDVKLMEEFARTVLAKGSCELLTMEAELRSTRDSPEYDLVPGTPVVRAIIKGFDEAALVLWRMERDASTPSGRPNYKAISYAAELHNSRLLDTFLEGPIDLIDPATGVSLLYQVGWGSLSSSVVGRVLRHGGKCKDSGVETIRTLLKYGAREHVDDIPGLPGCNILSLAVDYYSPEAVEFLMAELDCARFVNVLTPNSSIAYAHSQGKDIKYHIDQWKSSLLHRAMSFGRLRIFDILLEHGADVNHVHGSEDGPLTTLHHSVILCHDATYTKRLLATGKITNVDQAEPGFESPFCSAVRLRKFDIADCLLAHGADVNYLFVNGIRSFPVDQQAMTILAWTLQQEGSLSSLGCISYLLETGRASPWANREFNTTVLHTFAKAAPSTRGRYHKEFARRAFAMLDGSFDFTGDHEVLDARSENGRGYTALECAVINYKAVLVEKLVSAGADWEHAGPSEGDESALVLAMKLMYTFPRGLLLEENCPPKEKQLDTALSNLRHICLVLFRKARDKARKRSGRPIHSTEEMVQEEDGQAICGGLDTSVGGTQDPPTTQDY